MRAVIRYLCLFDAGADILDIGYEPDKFVVYARTAARSLAV